MLWSKIIIRIAPATSIIERIFQASVTTQETRLGYKRSPAIRSSFDLLTGRLHLSVEQCSRSSHCLLNILDSNIAFREHYPSHR